MRMSIAGYGYVIEILGSTATFQLSNARVYLRAHTRDISTNNLFRN
jgi:hypothetical protein